MQSKYLFVLFCFIYLLLFHGGGGVWVVFLSLLLWTMKVELFVCCSEACLLFPYMLHDLHNFLCYLTGRVHLNIWFGDARHWEQFFPVGMVRFEKWMFVLLKRFIFYTFILVSFSALPCTVLRSLYVVQAKCIHKMCYFFFLHFCLLCMYYMWIKMTGQGINKWIW